MVKWIGCTGRKQGEMDTLTILATIVIALLAFGAAALAFGTDSREGFDDVNRGVRHA